MQYAVWHPSTAVAQGLVHVGEVSDFKVKKQEDIVRMMEEQHSQGDAIRGAPFIARLPLSCAAMRCRQNVDFDNVELGGKRHHYHHQRFTTVMDLKTANPEI